MEDTVELGGNIQLNGFSGLDGATMIILKKIIGNFAKSFSEKAQFSKLSVSLDPGENYSLQVEVLSQDNKISASFQDKNVFFALDKALKEIETKI